MMSSIAYHSAVQLNNQGVKALESNGDAEIAHDYFKASIDVLTRSLSRKSQDVKQRTGAMEESDAIFEWSHRIHNLYQQTDRFVYARALHIIPATNSDDLIDFAHESAAIVFNLALVFHLIGLQRNRMEYLQRAMGFYEISQTIRFKTSISSCQQIAVHDLAILNNLGQLHYELCNYHFSREYFNMVAKELSCVRLLACVREDVNGFALNCLLRQEPQLAAAA
mmetsp:Transcript_23764/g.34038  ORF Transcript_23764/g.34038 Transcript_23764/m.34038 type:complete len:223 (-) Transcript_23764:246-914(-)